MTLLAGVELRDVQFTIIMDDIAPLEVNVSLLELQLRKVKYLFTDSGMNENFPVISPELSSLA